MKIKAVWVFQSLLLVLSLSLAGPVALADEDTVSRKQFTSKIDYRFVGHLEQLDDEGRLLSSY